MSGSIAEVLETVRNTEDGVPTLDVRVDGGKLPLKADHFDSAGVDAPPLPGDNAFAVDTEGSGNVATVGYHDPKNASKAADGERRTYARDANGEITAEIWSKANGDIKITSLKSGGKIDLNGVLIDQQGNLIVPGEITWMAVDSANPAPTANKASTHTHGSGVGPTTKPIPGT
jgi:YD repeat-containing protein